MPRSTGFFKKYTRDFIKDNIGKGARILDIGPGIGTYSDLLAGLGYSIDCIEAFAPYVDMFKLKDKYSQVYIGDATEVDIDFSQYNLVIMGDVLEHMDYHKAKILIERVSNVPMIVAVPFMSEQGVHYDNEYEIHRQPDLTLDIFLKRYSNFRPICIRHDFAVFSTINSSRIVIEEEHQDLEPDQLKYLKDNYPGIEYVKEQEYNLLEEANKPKTTNNEYTIVSGLWNIGREERDFDKHYVERFKEFLKIPSNMVLFVPRDLENIVWEHRSRTNTFVKIYELEDIKSLYSPHWDKTQEIRSNPDWIKISGEGGWLVNSPQAKLEYYNPVVMSKMFMLHEASLWSPFKTEYYYWLDAGITNTVPVEHLTFSKALDELPKHTNPFIFLSYPYESAGEIHGFDQKGMDLFAGEPVKYVCRGGLFGGQKSFMSQANSTYYHLLSETLSRGYMGTEESIFSIMAHKEPHLYRRYSLDENGFIVKFTEALINDKVELVEVDLKKYKKAKSLDTSKVKTNLYILTFNFPSQVLHTIDSMKKTPEWLEKPRLYLLDNSTSEEAKILNKQLATDHGFIYMDLGGNRGICGGRQYAAEHFHNSDADYYFFFEDDMTSNPPEYEGQFCRNGFRKYVPNLYEILHKIMIKEEFDYLKLSFTEVYWDNDIQTSWYNVPQDVRTKYWPDYDRLPTAGSDPNAPRTQFGKIGNVDGLAYIDGEVTYTNWPMIMSKEGNKKVFIETKWARPYEQTWMSYVFQKQKEGKVRAGVLLASPIWHERIKHYRPEERREN